MECPICWNVMKNDRICIGCGHIFHIECYLQWKMRSDKCPLCRKKMTTEYFQTIIYDILKLDIKSFRDKYKNLKSFSKAESKFLFLSIPLGYTLNYNSYFTILPYQELWDSHLIRSSDISKVIKYIKNINELDWTFILRTSNRYDIHLCNTVTKIPLVSLKTLVNDDYYPYHSVKVNYIINHCIKLSEKDIVELIKISSSAKYIRDFIRYLHQNNMKLSQKEYTYALSKTIKDYSAFSYILCRVKKIPDKIIENIILSLEYKKRNIQLVGIINELLLTRHIHNYKGSINLPLTAYKLSNSYSLYKDFINHSYPVSYYTKIYVKCLYAKRCLI